jgi:hypothetical protein
LIFISGAARFYGRRLQYVRPASQRIFMHDVLATYLADHLAGSVYAVELVKTIGEEHSHDSLGQFSAAILADIEADKAVLQNLSEQIGTGSSGLKEVTAWLGEKAGRLKLRHDSAGSLGTFEALEFLALGIQGKLALWRALAVAAPADVRLQALDYEHLASRAEEQHAKVEKRRLEVARTALTRERK